jgi:hypothetical protein
LLTLPALAQIYQEMAQPVDWRIECVALVRDHFTARLTGEGRRGLGVAIDHEEHKAPFFVPQQRRSAGKGVLPQLRRREETGQPGDAVWIGEERAVDATFLQERMGAGALFGVHMDPLFRDVVQRVTSRSSAPQVSRVPALA